MISISGKMADKIAAKKMAAFQEEKTVHKKAVHKKLASTLKGSELSKVQKKSAKTKAQLDKKANPDSLAKSKKKVATQVKKLGLKHAGFGRYHKGKGTPVIRWVMRNPKNGLYLLADKELRAKILGKDEKPVAKVAKKPVAKVAKKPVEPKLSKLVSKTRGRPSNAKKAHEATKAKLTEMHLARLDKKRSETLAKKGKKSDAPLSKREQERRANSVKKLHSVLDKNFANQQSGKKAGKKTVKKVTGVK